MKRSHLMEKTTVLVDNNTPSKRTTTQKASPFSLHIQRQAKTPQAIAELQSLSQWCDFKKEIREGEKKPTKVPYQPNNHRASSSDYTTWTTHEKALYAYHSLKLFDGIGFFFNGKTYSGIDIDDCVDEHGIIAEWAWSIIRLLDSYTEFSTSGTGVHIVVNALLPTKIKDTKGREYVKGHKNNSPVGDVPAKKLELYSERRFFVVTGQHVPGTPTTINERQDQLLSILNTFFLEPKAEKERAFREQHPQTPKDYQPAEIPQDDNDLWQIMFHSKNGSAIESLYYGDASRYRGDDGSSDESAADAALAAKLVYYTQHDASRVERMMWQTGLVRDKWKTHSIYLKLTIDNAMKFVADDFDPLYYKREAERKSRRRQERSIPHIPVVPRVTIEEHREKLTQIGKDIQDQIRTHIKSQNESILIVATPPGVGKSRLAAAIGVPTTQPTGNANVAWIAQRHNMVDSVEDLGYYRHIQACTEHNCSHDEIHHWLSTKGYNSWSLHSKHTDYTGAKYLCDYAHQFLEQGSAVYQQAHIHSSYPAQHEAIILDELDPSSWLPEREVTLEKLHDTLIQYEPNSCADTFLRTLQGLLTDCAQEGTSLYGKALFDALDQKLHGRLTETLGVLDKNAYNRNAHPYIEIDPDDPEEETRVQHLASVLMPHLLRALMSELVKWQHGQEWNSCLRIGPGHGTDYRLYITEPVQFVPDKDGHLPPVILLDATADEEVHSCLLGRKITIEHALIHPAPDTQHIAIRSGKRYGKTALTTQRKDGSANRDLQRAIAEAKYMLQKLDPDGEQIRSEKVGIISFLGCVDAMGEALGIPEHRRGHYWGIRGSNALEDCSLLLLIGTPTLQPDELLRQARALYRDDPLLLQETSPEQWKQTGEHTDPRLQHYAEYTTNAELTQAAHRNRPIRHEKRTVVSFCSGDIDFLPATETITELPYLTPEGEDSSEARRKDQEARLEKAYADLTKDGKQPTQEELRKAAKVRKATAAQWMREYQHTDVVIHQSTRDTIEDITYSTPGTLESGSPENAPPEAAVDQPDPLELFWAVGQRHNYPEVADLGLKSGKLEWGSFSRVRWLRIPDVVARFRKEAS
jgi:primase-polymerase (primpol)-like protein